MRKVDLLILVGLIFLTGCHGLVLDDSATHQAIAYSAGKAMGIGINRLAPQVDADLSRSWVDLMQSGAGAEMIAPTQLRVFYNDMLQIISRQVDDPYGLIGDLGVLLMIFGAQYDEAGGLVSINPVPMAIMRMFELGYTGGRRVARSGT